MAEQNQGNEKSGGRRVSPIMTLIVLAGVLCLQVGTVGLAYWLWGGPSEVRADSAAEDEAAKAQQPTEILVVDSQFQNTRTGRSFLYDMEVYVVAKQKHSEYLKPRLESRKAQIVTEIATIVRRAERSYFHEPELSTLTRQIRAALNRVFGRTEAGETYIQQVLIKKLTEYRTDG